MTPPRVCDRGRFNGTAQVFTTAPYRFGFVTKEMWQWNGFRSGRYTALRSEHVRGQRMRRSEDEQVGLANESLVLDAGVGLGIPYDLAQTVQGRSACFGPPQPVKGHCQESQVAWLAIAVELVRSRQGGQGS